MNKFSCGPIKSIEPACANPQSAPAVFTDGFNPVGTQRAAVLWIKAVMNKLAGVSIELIKSRIRCSNPDRARPILKKHTNVVAAYGRGVYGIMSIVLESHFPRRLAGSLHGIKLIEAAASGANPYCPLSIFQHGLDIITAQAVRIDGIVPEMRKHPGPSIEPLQATSRRNPNLASVVFTNPLNSIVGQTPRMRRIM